MSVSQNKKNEQQNNLCTTLTEQWKKGELEDGFYYVEEDGKTFISICRKHYLLQVLQDCKVLAPVPTFDEHQQLHKFLEEFNALEVAKENQQLKELLKQWVHFYPIVLYEYEDTLKTKDIIELYEKTANAIGEKK